MQNIIKQYISWKTETSQCGILTCSRFFPL